MSDTDTDATTDVPTDTGDANLDFDSPDDAAATVVTQGDPIRSLLDAVTVLVDDAKVRFSPDGFTVTAVDPANVGMVDLNAPSAAFTGFDSQDALVVGMPLERLQNALKFARKGRKGDSGDPVRIDVIDDDDRMRVRVAVIRPDQQAKRVSEFFAIDPNSIRQEPDIPSLGLPHQAQPDIDGFQAAIRDLKRNHDHVWLGRTGPTLVLGSQPTPTSSTPSNSRTPPGPMTTRTRARGASSAWITWRTSPRRRRRRRSTASPSGSGRKSR